MERTPSLFEPVSLGGLTLANRIAVSPMCQYSAENGAANDWHLQHLGSLSLSGAGLVIVEQTAVEPAGRISHGCLGLYSDANEAALARVVDFCRRAGSAALGIQLAHAGRKGSAKLPWEGGGPLPPDAGAWTTAAPSAIPFDNRWPAPQALDEAGLARIRDAHADGGKARRAVGFRPGRIAGRARISAAQLPLPDRQSTNGSPTAAASPTACAIRSKWRPRSARSGRAGKRSACASPARDWVDGGITPDEAGIFAGKLRDIGFDYVCVSSGGISPAARPAIAPGYQVPFAAAVKKASGIAVQAVGMIVDPHQARSDRCRRPGGLCRAGARVSRRPALGLACRRCARRRCRLSAAILRARPEHWPGAALTRHGLSREGS